MDRSFEDSEATQGGGARQFVLREAILALGVGKGADSGCGIQGRQ